MSKPPIYDHGCARCPLHEEVQTVCVEARFSRKPVPEWRPKILFVGEAPGVEEDRIGAPFVGPAGQLLTEALKHYGIRDFAITNTVKCRPPENRKPKAKEIAACSDFLSMEIRRFEPQIVVAVGAIALGRITGLKKITDWAGRVIDVPGRAWKVFPIIHPAAVLRYESRYLQPFEAQIKGLARLARGDKPTPSNYVRVTLREAVKRLNGLAESEGPYGFDVETMPLHPGFATNPKFSRILCASISEKEGEGFWWVWPGEPDPELIYAFVRLLSNRKRTMVPHNAIMEVKYLLWHVVREWEEMEGTGGSAPEEIAASKPRDWEIGDSMLDYYLLHEDTKGAYDLDAVRRAVVPEMPDYSAAVMEKVNSGTPHHEIDIDELGAYNAGDSDAALRIHNRLWPRIAEKPGLLKAWGCLRESVFGIARAELAGRKMDFDRADFLREQFDTTDRTCGMALREMPVVKRFCRRDKREIGDFNPNSSQQVGKILFNYLKLPVLKETETGKASTGADYIAPFREKSKFVRTYLDLKSARTLKGYLKQYLGLVAPDGVLYGSYLPHGAATARWSSVAPNLQNFTALLRTIIVSRFGPRGWIISADYSQLELRLIAWLADCKILLEAYKAKKDVHAITGARVVTALQSRKWSVSDIIAEQEDAEKHHREPLRKTYGKEVNFGLAYGMYPKRFAQEKHLPLEQAEIIYGAFHGLYPEFNEYQDKCGEIIRRKGWIESVFGFRRRLPDGVGDFPERSKAAWKQKDAIREGANHTVQNPASIINSLAFCRMQKEIEERGLRGVGFGATHDSQDFDVPEEELEVFAPLLRKVMVEETHSLFPFIGVPLEIDVKYGRSWGDLKKWTG